MSLLTNLKTFINVGFLAGTDMTVTKAFGNYDNAAAAQADVNTLAEILDSGVTVRKFSKRKPQQVLCLEDILGEREEPEKKPEPKSREQTLMEWWNSLTPDEQKFFQDLNK